MLSADYRNSAVVENALAFQCRDRTDDEVPMKHQKTNEHAACNGRDRPYTTTDHVQQATDRRLHSDEESCAGQTQSTIDESRSKERNRVGPNDPSTAVGDDAPVPVVLRSKYAVRQREMNVDDGRYRECLARIRRRLTGRKIWASVDETTNPKDGQTLCNVVVGTLSPDGPGETFLLASGVLRGGDGGGAADPEAAARLFRTAVGLLWSDSEDGGGGRGEFSLLVSGLQPTDWHAINGWPGVGPRTVVVACVARQLHAVAERICADFPAVDSLVSMVRRASLQHGHRVHASWIEAASYLNENLATVRDALADRPDRRVSWPVWRAGRLTVDPRVEPGLAFVDLNYGFLPAAVAQVQARGAAIARTVDAVSQAADRLADVPGELGAAVYRRFADALRDNHGFRVLADVADVMAGRAVTMDRLPKHLSAGDLKYFKYAPVAAVDARATFPPYEAVFSAYNRLKYDERSLNKLLVVQCNDCSVTNQDDRVQPTRVPTVNRHIRPHGHDVGSQSPS